ncbi:MAG: hypothetical protein ACREDE_04205, partial [Thermoplasmata archaeon]
MADPSLVCPHCGAALPNDVLVCPTCHAPLDLPSSPPDPSISSKEPMRAGSPEPPTPPASGADPAAGLPAVSDSASTAKRAARRPPSSGGNPFAAELSRRLARVAQWAASAEPLGVRIPKLPAWAEETARTSSNPEPWAEAVRGIERIAQKRILVGFEEWQKRTRSRLTRLEAYAVDSRLERDQIEDTLHAARTGDIAQALSTFQQVDRVVSLKERHLDQAREELERVIALLRDMQALGVD